MQELERQYSRRQSLANSDEMKQGIFMNSKSNSELDTKSGFTLCELFLQKEEKHLTLYKK